MQKTRDVKLNPMEGQPEDVQWKLANWPLKNQPFRMVVAMLSGGPVEVVIVAIAIPRQTMTHVMMKIVRPHGASNPWPPCAAEVMTLRSFRASSAIRITGLAKRTRRLVYPLRQLRQEMWLTVIMDGIGRVRAQSIHMIIVYPGQCALDESRREPSLVPRYRNSIHRPTMFCAFRV